jgi:hypothetical protein
VYWKTATEQNNALFVIERSFDGIYFEKAAERAGAGTVFTTQEYEWFDTDIRPGITYYRLKQIDDNGTFTYSQTISCSRKEESYLYPNPAATHVQVDLSPFLSRAGTLVVTDISGRMVQRTSVPERYESAGLSVDVSLLNAGIYAVHFINTTGIEVHTQRLVVSR